MADTFSMKPDNKERFVPGEDLVEKLAFIEHERWAEWQKYLFSLCDVNPNGSFTIPSFFVKKWQDQIKTPYTHLTEQEKQSDRDQVMRYLHLIRKEPFGL